MFGAVMFLLGSVSSPKAANENETLSLMCKRLKATGHLKQAEDLMWKARQNKDLLEEKAQLAIMLSLTTFRDVVCIGQ